MGIKLSKSAIGWFCIAMMFFEIFQAYNAKENVILYALHSLESTLWLLALVYFRGKDTFNFTINNKVNIKEQGK